MNGQLQPRHIQPGLLEIQKPALRLQSACLPDVRSQTCPNRFESGVSRSKVCASFEVLLVEVAIYFTDLP